ncbi:hypothetical protein GIB67_039111 [Kingdonia uniflora]|uniref:Uncharacterized protein n=1 Tax=Kingdonia uniflora TaxID=39325 RepID=A0A7J7LLC2_9MAGN|nr:hypothetical protein GIB67_039111 [Kingdonia uniflora]
MIGGVVVVTVYIVDKNLGVGGQQCNYWESSKTQQRRRHHTPDSSEVVRAFDRGILQLRLVPFGGLWVLCPSGLVALGLFTSSEACTPRGLLPLGACGLWPFYLFRGLYS